VKKDQVLEDPKIIEDHILSFYKNIYYDSIGSSFDFHTRLIAKHIPNLVLDEENSMLIKCPNFEEIKQVIFNIIANNPSGLIVLVVPFVMRAGISLVLISVILLSNSS